MKENNLWEEKSSIEQQKNLKNNLTFDQKNTIIKTKNIVTEKGWKDITIPKKSGIYKIINKITNQYYVGSTVNFMRRWYQHKVKLNKNLHCNPHLQYAWNKYGCNNFEFKIVEYIEELGLNNKKLLECEQRYLDIAKNEKLLGSNTHYNINYESVSIMLGKKHNLNTINKMSYSKIGSKNPFYKKKHTNDTKLKISYSMKNKMCNEKNGWFKKGYKQIGKNNANYNKNIYKFYNTKTSDIFYGTKYEIRKLYNLNRTNLDKLLNGKINHYKGWILEK